MSKSVRKLYSERARKRMGSPAGLEGARLAHALSDERPDLYDAPNALDGRVFDVLYTGLGAIYWLPDIPRWARVVASGLLRALPCRPVTSRAVKHTGKLQGDR